MTNAGVYNKKKENSSLTKLSIIHKLFIFGRNVYIPSQKMKIYNALHNIETNSNLKVE